MLPPGAFAVVLLLNGAQIMLPAPAFVDQGRVWAPAREVLQRLGLTVRWQSEPRAMVALRGDATLIFPEKPPPWPVPSNPAEAQYARRVGDLLYIPLLALRSVGTRIGWEPVARQVTLQQSDPGAVKLAAILNDPGAWAGRRVTVTGEYLGWDSCPFSYATAAGPPVAIGDWVLADGDGAIYCSAATAPVTPSAAGLAPVRHSPPQLTPYLSLGRRLSVTGVVELAPSGVPYLLHEEVQLLRGKDGRTCYLALHQQELRPGDMLGWAVSIQNPGPEGFTLPENPHLLLSIALPGNVMVLRQGLGSRGLITAGDQMVVTGQWRVPDDTAAGTYAISVRLNDVLQSHVRHFQVTDTPALPHEP